MSETAKPDWWPLYHEEGSTEFSRIGKDWRTLRVAELEALGHRKRPLLSLIRQNCIDCGGGSEAEVRQCAIARCPFWPYRMNTNPIAAPQSEERRTASGERLRRLRTKQADFAENSPLASSFAAAEASGGVEIAA